MFIKFKLGQSLKDLSNSLNKPNPKQKVINEEKGVDEDFISSEDQLELNSEDEDVNYRKELKERFKIYQDKYKNL